MFFPICSLGILNVTLFFLMELAENKDKFQILLFLNIKYDQPLIFSFFVGKPWFVDMLPSNISKIVYLQYHRSIYTYEHSNQNVATPSFRLTALTLNKPNAPLLIFPLAEVGEGVKVPPS